MKRWLAVVGATFAFASAAAIALTFAGGPGDQPPTVRPSPTASLTPTPSPSTVTPTPDVPPNVLSVAIDEPVTLDPMRVQNPGELMVARQLYEGLTRWDPIEEQVVPAAAESWTSTDGGRRFVFRLRPGIVFHNGAPVTSRDFRFAFDRLARRKNASDLAYLLQLVEGFRDVNDVGDARHLDGLSTPDDATLVIRLSEPYQDLPAILTHPGLVPVLRSSVADLDSFLSKPIGNGPFRMAAEWVPGEDVVLEAFRGWTEVVDLAGIRFVPFADPGASWREFDAGDLDVAQVPPNQIADAQDTYGDRGYRPLLAGYYFGLNLRSPDFSDPRLRRAVNRAIDREAIAENVVSGTMRTPRGIVPAGMPGFDQDACGELCDYSPEAARALIADLPRARRNITIEYTLGQPHVQIASALRDSLERVGLRVELRSYSFANYVGLLESGAQSMYRLGWIAEYPSPDAFLSPLFASDSSDNHSGFASRRVDRLLDEARAEPYEAKQVTLYRRAEHAILDEVPVMPVGSFVTHWAAQAWVERIAFDAMGGFDAAGVTLGERSDGAER